jgi:hypothetical protein
MNRRLNRAIALACMTLAGTPVHAQSTALVNFDPPGTVQGPSIFVAVPAIQNITTEPATFGGGVVLGLATFFPAIQFATGPNVYGTADFGNNLGRALTININPTFGNVNQVSFALFNGETYTESYQVNAFSGSSLVASQTLNNILPNFNSGYAIADVSVNALQNTPITQVTITTTTNAHTTWDFLIDTVTFNQSITSVVPVPVYVPQTPNTPSVPPPVYVPQPPPLPSVENQNPEIIKRTQEQSDGRQKRKRKGKDGNDEIVEVVTVINFGDDSLNSKSNSLELDLTNKTVQIYAAPIIQSPVPEPTTWALMLAGIAGLGLMARRRSGQGTDRLRG